MPEEKIKQIAGKQTEIKAAKEATVEQIKKLTSDMARIYDDAMAKYDKLDAQTKDKSGQGLTMTRQEYALKIRITVRVRFGNTYDRLGFSPEKKNEVVEQVMDEIVMRESAENSELVNALQKEVERRCVLEKQLEQKVEELAKEKSERQAFEEKLKNMGFEFNEGAALSQEQEQIIEKIESVSMHIKEVIDAFGRALEIKQIMSGEKLKNYLLEKFEGIVAGPKLLIREIKEGAKRSPIAAAALGRENVNFLTKLAAEETRNSLSDQEKVLEALNALGAVEVWGEKKLEIFKMNGIIPFCFLIDSEAREHNFDVRETEIESKLQDLFRDVGLKAIDVAEGRERYDPYLHESLRWVDDEKYKELQPDTIVRLSKRGFIYKEKVIRRARVIVKQ